MNQSAKANTAENEIGDFTTFAGVLCHLMTLYALRPCEPLANNIHQHFKILLDSTASYPLGEWIGTFHQLMNTWESIAVKHQQDALQENITAPQIELH